MTDRLEEILKDPFHRWLVEPEDKRKAWQVAADALRAAGATVPEPPLSQPYPRAGRDRVSADLVVYRHRYGQQKGFTLSVESATVGRRIMGMKFGVAEHVEIARFHLDDDSVEAIVDAYAESKAEGGTDGE